MKTAFVFPGQGSQAVGMGKNLFENLEPVKNIYDIASEALGYDVAYMSFNGPTEELNKTFRTQPCLLTASIAAHVALAGMGIMPDAVAGHSLGEYSALVAAGSMAFRDAVKITEQRGLIMQDAVPEGKGLMAAILGIDRKTLDDICNSVSSGYVAAANYNCPGQIVISGEKAAVEEAMAKAKEAGAKRALPLAVSVPSHSRLMQEAGAKFSKVLDSANIRDASVSFVNNTDARIISDAAEIKDSLVRQMSQSVLWEDCVSTLIASGVSAFVEVGPGKVLSGLIKRIDGNVKIFNVENMESLEKTASELGSLK
ncbi:MAG: ACP S-malonyltransferase [Nitrospiraceae bacterium]|nr:ACP S-malonyltransferase [Nitrospiraceae bacterium]